MMSFSFLDIEVYYSNRNGLRIEIQPKTCSNLGQTGEEIPVSKILSLRSSRSYSIM